MIFGCYLSKHLITRQNACKFSVGAFSASASAPPILTALHQVETLHNIWLLTADWRHYVTTDFPPDCSAASLCDPFMDRHVLPQL